MTGQQALDLVWDYMLMKQPLGPADMMLVGGCSNSLVADWAASLMLRGLAPLVTVSGGLTPMAKQLWGTSEAQHFADGMIARGVPAEVILIEDRATNTGENVKFSAEMWAERGLDPQKVLGVFKPYMERRAYAAMKKWWPQREVVMTSPPVTRAQWMGSLEIPAHEDASCMVGDLWRVIHYPAKGFQIPQPVPREVEAALTLLTQAGYQRVVRSGEETRPKS